MFFSLPVDFDHRGWKKDVIYLGLPHDGWKGIKDISKGNIKTLASKPELGRSRMEKPAREKKGIRQKGHSLFWENKCKEKGRPRVPGKSVSITEAATTIDFVVRR